MRKLLAILTALLVLSTLPDSSLAQVRLPGIFGDHMVLQRNENIKIWGWAEPGQAIEAVLNDSQGKAKADQEGKWQILLAPQKAGGPFELRIATTSGTKSEVTLSDILIGEVWVCSGQSNMEWPLSQSANPQEEINAADYPNIRHIKVTRRPSSIPLDTIDNQWNVCSPKTAGSFTGVGYFFARRLHQELNVPIGLINSSWGGTRVEPWTPPNGFAQVPELANIHDTLESRTPGTDRYQQKLSNHIDATQAWLENAKSALKDQKAIDPSPAFPSELAQVTGHQNPAMLYNGMIHHFIGFPIRGAIWYQGESNRADGMSYFHKKKALINGWRELWEQGDFPFYFVQIAPFNYGNDRPDQLPELWEAQTKTLELPNTGMVVISDVTDLNDIHPRNKQDVGLRLANLALKNDYGQDGLLVSGPTLDSLKILEDRLVLKFSNTGDGLKTSDGTSPDWFEVIGKGTNFETANAEISGDTVVLTCNKVPAPVAVRFGWNKKATPNLRNSANLPARPFRAGEVPTALNSVPEIDDYQLIYDLDLKRLGKEIEYDKDLRKQVDKFDRIGYFMELQKTGQPMQFAFVSMDAFTDNIDHIGIPTIRSGATFQKKVSKVRVHSNVEQLENATATTGHIEFWPNNYGATRSANLGGSDTIYDFDDTRTDPVDGYGSMQVHLPESGLTLFSINRWNAPDQADLGIGNCPGQHLDWTFSGNSSQYDKKRLRIFVRAKK